MPRIKRHVDLHHLGLEVREAGQPGVARAQIVDRDAVAERAQLRDARRDVADLLQRRALRDLQDDARGVARQRRRRRDQRVVVQLHRVQVDEQQRRHRLLVQRARDAIADGAPQLLQPPQPLRRLEQIGRRSQRRLLVADQRLVRERRCGATTTRSAGTRSTASPSRAPRRASRLARSPRCLPSRRNISSASRLILAIWCRRTARATTSSSSAGSTGLMR